MHYFPPDFQINADFIAVKEYSMQHFTHISRILIWILGYYLNDKKHQLWYKTISCTWFTHFMFTSQWLQISHLEFNSKCSSLPSVSKFSACFVKFNAYRYFCEYFSYLKFCLHLSGIWKLSHNFILVRHEMLTACKSYQSLPKLYEITLCSRRHFLQARKAVI